MIYIEPELLKRVNTWLTPSFDNDTQTYIKDLIATNPDELKEAFYKDLEFGTGGMRGVMGIGTNRINKFTLGKNTQGLSNYMHQVFPGETLKVAIAYDCRHNSKTLAKVVANVFSANNIEVYLFEDLRPTPELSFTLKHLNCHCGIVLTASHNPPEYNGIKVIWKDGIEIAHSQETEIEEIYFNNNQKLAKWNKLGLKHELSGINSEYINGIKKHVNISKIVDKKFHVVVDAGNSVGGITTPYLLQQLGCKVTTLNANIDGTFPSRLPEPKPETLKELSATVKAIKADLGVAFDGDADRSIFVDEKGEIHWGDKTFSLIIKHFLIKNPNEKIITPVSSSTLVKDTVEFYKGKLIWTKVGSVTVSQTMKKENAKLGGEENGGVFYGPHQSVRDGAMTTALLLEIMANTDKKLSSLIEEQPQYYIEKGKVECIEEQKKECMNKMLSLVEKEKISTIDGIKIWFDDKSAILIRPSGTEPAIRLYAEAKNRKRALKLIQEFGLKLKEILSTIE